MAFLPIVKVTHPTSLLGYANGALPSGLLRSVGPSGQLHVNAARAFLALQAAAKRAGFHLTYTYGGTYRSLQSQRSLFLARYTPSYDERVNTLDGSRTYEGRRWYKKKGMASVATPGTSNHGWGLAIDLAIDRDPSDGIGPEDAIYIGPAMDWLVANAWRYGFSWELQSEPWHVRYVTGDAIPAAVLDFERTGSTVPPTFAPLRLGARGSLVAYLQRVLVKCQPSVIVDGSFGAQTERAVRAFQQCVGTTVDGFVGPQTWEHVRNVGDGFGVPRP